MMYGEFIDVNDVGTEIMATITKNIVSANPPRPKIQEVPLSSSEAILNIEATSITIPAIPNITFIIAQIVAQK